MSREKWRNFYILKANTPELLRGAAIGKGCPGLYLLDGVSLVALFVGDDPVLIRRNVEEVSVLMNCEIDETNLVVHGNLHGSVE